ncbi:hypothetical protein M409DRAFT_59042 [Zasmidium cellare ATCC 36951]|uniref:Uncharacterized protein n=1 Tax=Zasmidium cellare ATCC 36951 TaxID=1080233 RepID=A0A6A6C6Z8_ZASCE|nr:uncharacterized protein M409DRAFT_59042 [Zasmidium cellare ATCC 36951]KAF2161662.1 hypothetical protein M409DRAFT_59042 [Zasmidium cellare ATCC 36951]
MVQHRTKNGDQPDDYWKLTKDLRSTVNRLSPGAFERAQELFSRKLRGSLDYERCTVKELTRFSLHRQLLKAQEGSLESHRHGDGASSRMESEQEKASLVALLEKADNDQGFDRFLDLPPELRACVYDSYFRLLLEMNDESLTSPLPPPITEVCSVLRKETLKPFYQTCFLDLRFEESSGNYRMAEKESRFFLNAPPSHVAMVRKIKLRCEFRTGGLWFPVAVETDIGTGAVPAKTELLNGTSLT